MFYQKSVEENSAYIFQHPALVNIDKRMSMAPASSSSIRISYLNMCVYMHVSHVISAKHEKESSVPNKLVSGQYKIRIRRRDKGTFDFPTYQMRQT